MIFQVLKTGLGLAKVQNVNCHFSAHFLVEECVTKILDKALRSCEESGGRRPRLNRKRKGERGRSRGERWIWAASQATTMLSCSLLPSTTLLLGFTETIVKCLQAATGTRDNLVLNWACLVATTCTRNLTGHATPKTIRMTMTRPPSSAADLKRGRTQKPFLFFR